jgi:hypothetical protein
MNSKPTIVSFCPTKILVYREPAAASTEDTHLVLIQQQQGGVPFLGLDAEVMFSIDQWGRKYPVVILSEKGEKNFGKIATRDSSNRLRVYKTICLTADIDLWNPKTPYNHQDLTLDLNMTVMMDGTEIPSTASARKEFESLPGKETDFLKSLQRKIHTHLDGPLINAISLGSIVSQWWAVMHYFPYKGVYVGDLDPNVFFNMYVKY